MHRAGNAFDEDQFDGDENAIVDFKYSPDRRLTWWFDHHQSAFLSKADEENFLADTRAKNFLIQQANRVVNLLPESPKKIMILRTNRSPN